MIKSDPPELEPASRDVSGAAAELPLAGIRVLDVGTFIAAPYAATLLAEFGADVIKIEQPGAGDPLRAFGTPSAHGTDTLCWLSESRNKRTITLDLHAPDGAAIFRRLVSHADVVCENFRPGTLEGWGLGFDQLVAVNPDLVMLRVSGYGQTGPMRDRAGFARIAHAFGGLAHLTGMPDGPPLTPGSTSLADYISGLYGALGVMIALHARSRVGGQYIDVALYESVFRLLDDLAPSYAQSGVVRGRLGLGTSNASPHGHYVCQDGGWIALACSSDKIFARFAHLIGQPGLADPTRFGAASARISNRDEMDRVVAEWLSGMSAAEAVRRCAEAGVPCAPVHTIADIFTDPQFRARRNLQVVSDPVAGDVTVPNIVPVLSRTPGRIKHLGRPLGADTNELLQELLGVSDAELARLRRDGTI